MIIMKTTQRNKTKITTEKMSTVVTRAKDGMQVVGGRARHLYSKK